MKDLIEDDDSDTVVKKTRKISFEYLDCGITALHRVVSSQTSTVSCLRRHEKKEFG